MELSQITTVAFTLFAVIDMLGSVPVIISLKKKIPDIHASKVTVAAGILMISFLYAGEFLLNFLGVDKASFAVAGSIVMFILGLEMVLGIDILNLTQKYRVDRWYPLLFPWWLVPEHLQPYYL